MHTGVCKHVLLTHAGVYGKAGKPQATMMLNLSLWDMTLLFYVATVLRSIRAFFTCQSSSATSADVSPPSPLPNIPGADGVLQW